MELSQDLSQEQKTLLLYIQEVRKSLDKIEELARPQRELTNVDLERAEINGRIREKF